MGLCKCLSVQEVIDALQKVADKTKPCCVWVNSCSPEVSYSGGSRVPVVYVDDLVNFGVTDVCCECVVDTERAEFCKECATRECDKEHAVCIACRKYYGFPLTDKEQAVVDQNAHDGKDTPRGTFAFPEGGDDGEMEDITIEEVDPDEDGEDEDDEEDEDAQ